MGTRTTAADKILGVGGDTNHRHSRIFTINMPDSYFSIPVLIPETDVLTFLSVHAVDRTFTTELFGDPISLIYKEDNSWSLLKGAADQETVDVIGEAIQAHHLKQNNNNL